MKTKIYWTIKGLIILFIKFRFFIRCNQAFKLLHTSISNIYLNLSLNPNGFITYIISDTFVSSPIYCMIPDMHLQRFLCIKSSQIQTYVFTIKPEGHWSIYQEAFVILINALMFIEDKVDVYTREKSELHLVRFSSTPPLRSAQRWYTLCFNK